MDRVEVYNRIDQERDYQQQRWEDGRRLGDLPDAAKDPETWILYIEHHLNLAKERAYNLDKEETMAQLRKVAALAVAAMEIHGCPKRDKN